jgi:hypothetical protein
MPSSLIIRSHYSPNTTEDLDLSSNPPEEDMGKLLQVVMFAKYTEAFDARAPVGSVAPAVTMDDGPTSLRNDVRESIICNRELIVDLYWSYLMNGCDPVFLPM